MQITTDKQPPLNHWVTALKNRRTLSIVLLLVIYSAFLLISGAFLQKEGTASHVRDWVAWKTLVPYNYLLGILSPAPEALTIDIKYKHFQKLINKREDALKLGLLVTANDDYVPAKIRHRDQTVKVSIRLKGDLVEDQLQGDKWSFRIDVKNGDTLFGMKRFSIHHPRARNYLYEWLFHQTAKKEGLIAIRYKFINVTLNGKDLGIYALEEHFEKQLIENNERREGPILKLISTDVEAQVVARSSYVEAGSTAWNEAMNSIGSYLVRPVSVFNENRTLGTSSLRESYLMAQSLFERFRRGELPASQVFDVERYAKYIALCDLFGTFHGLSLGQFRFYYNPVTSLLEPIPFDLNNAGSELSKLKLAATHSNENQTDFMSNLFKDVTLWKLYVSELEKLSQPDYLNKLLKGLDKDIMRQLHILYREFPNYRFSTHVLYRNQAYIQQVLNPIKAFYAYYEGHDTNGLQLVIGNIQQIPVEILNVSYKDQVFQPIQPILLPARPMNQVLNYQHFQFVPPADFKPEIFEKFAPAELKIQYRVVSSSHTKQESNIFPWPYLQTAQIQQDLMREIPNVQDFPFIIVDDATRQITFKPGTWVIKNNLIIPKGYTVIAGAGVELVLTDNAKIISRSPLEFLGSAEQFIVIRAEGSGQGLVVMSNGRPSVLEYVRFDNLSEPVQGSWKITGAVTFYESPVNFKYCAFMNNRSEDSLNVIRATFMIANSLFYNTKSDAFDADFGRGEIIHSAFVNLGNDGIDVSGTSLKIEDVIVNHAGDKGISIGENSQATLTNADIENSEIAVASKDLSTLTAKYVNITNCAVGFTVYQKKPEYGPAIIQVAKLNLERVQVPYLVEPKSTLTVDKERIPESNIEHVKNILYGKEFGKASR